MAGTHHNTAPVCPNGHISASADAVFCILCGARVGALAPPPQQQPISPQFSPQHHRQQGYAPPQPYPPPQFPHRPLPVPVQNFCRHCGGEGRALAPNALRCAECSWLRPLAPGYAMDCAAFQWSEDGKAMAALRSISPLNAAARAISDKIGRRWVETAFNGVLLSEEQLPDVYAQAVRAARILGMPYMPDVYVSGERMWDCLTFGSDKNSFVVIGSALVTNFRGPELLFLLAREMGHCRAGHALWKTVIRFLLGEQGPRKGLMSNGLFAALSPTALVEGALEMPLLAWARQAEITADRAGLLAIGDEEIARRVLLSWSLKSAFLYKQINIASWLEQQAASDDGLTKLSELTTSSTPYITRRLKLLTAFAASPDLQRWQTHITQLAGPLPATTPAPNSPPPTNSPPAPPARPRSLPAPHGRSLQAGGPTNLRQPVGSAPPPGATMGGAGEPRSNTDLRLACAACRTPLRVPAAILAGKAHVNVRCPHESCGKVIALKKKSAPPAKAKQPVAGTPNENERNLTDGHE